MFPNLKVSVAEENPQIQTYGQRIYRDQTVYEYLLEFLLVFVSPKVVGDERVSELAFAIPNDEESGEIRYSPSPRMGLKRFVFFEHSPKDKRFRVDSDAYREHRNLIRDLIKDDNGFVSKDFVVRSIQELFYGFRAVTRKRSWFAQSLLPIAPELIFCEAIGRKSKRKNMKLEDDLARVDTEFNFHDRVFMARGGEVYYLHILQGLVERPELKEPLETALRNLLSQFDNFSVLSSVIDSNWRKYKHQGTAHLGEDEERIEKDCKWIPDGYAARASNTCSELINLLTAQVDFTKKVEIMGSLIVIQIARMMCEQAQLVLGIETRLRWVVSAGTVRLNNIKRYSVESYKSCEEQLFSAVHTADIDTYLKKGNKKRSELSALNDAAKDTSKLFRRLTKAIGFVVPPTGANPRFCVNDHMVDLLVMALLKPGEKILLSTFLERCHSHFGIVVGPAEASAYLGDTSVDLTEFDENQKAFQELLKNCGYLRSLSDATSIVENPFGGSMQ